MDSRGGHTADSDTLLRNYRLGKTLGHGSFGKVKIAVHVLTGYNVAVKILNRRKMNNPDSEEKVRREIKICRSLVHPHITRLYEVIETPSDIFVVMEHVESGELYYHITQRGRFHEDEARRLFQQIISGVEYCHRNMIVHRDLKPENLLLDSRGNVKIADFGLSNIMRDGHFLKTSCGSPDYAAPEVVSGKFYPGPEVDVWSCGVILYALLCGKLPFDDENIPNIFKKIKCGSYTIPSHLSPGARDLITRMLVVNPMKRITIPEIRQDQWFKLRIPRYLAVPPPDAMQHLKKLEEEIIQQVLSMGFDRTHLLESLQNRIQNDATVAYYLLFDNRSLVSSGYLEAEFQESMEACSPGFYADLDLHISVGHGSHQDYSLRPHATREKFWILGLQTSAPPSQIMTQVLGTLRELKVKWKKIGLYNMKCLWLHHIQDSDQRLATNHMIGCDFLPNETTMSANTLQAQPHVVKFEMQLYKVEDEKYILDLQRVTGPHFLFLKFCAIFIMLLEGSHAVAFRFC